MPGRRSTSPLAHAHAHPRHSNVRSATPGAPSGRTRSSASSTCRSASRVPRAVAISIVSVDSVAPGYVQALPNADGHAGRLVHPERRHDAQIQPNFAIVPVGVDGSITLYLYAGGNVVVDLMGIVHPCRHTVRRRGSLRGRRPGARARHPARVERTGATRVHPTHARGGETVRVTGIPAGASAAVVNVVADQAHGQRVPAHAAHRCHRPRPRRTATSWPGWRRARSASCRWAPTARSASSPATPPTSWST